MSRSVPPPTAVTNPIKSAPNRSNLFCMAVCVPLTANTKVPAKSRKLIMVWFIIRCSHRQIHQLSLPVIRQLFVFQHQCYGNPGIQAALLPDELATIFLHPKPGIQNNFWFYYPLKVLVYSKRNIVRRTGSLNISSFHYKIAGCPFIINAVSGNFAFFVYFSFP